MKQEYLHWVVEMVNGEAYPIEWFDDVQDAEEYAHVLHNDNHNRHYMVIAKRRVREDETKKVLSEDEKDSLRFVAVIALFTTVATVISLGGYLFGAGVALTLLAVASGSLFRYVWKKLKESE